tara:strand:- start:1438 stop:1584 length:147 start_codon:yes stop_codon:yes gene_type:complete
MQTLVNGLAYLALRVLLELMELMELMELLLLVMDKFLLFTLNRLQLML